MPEGAHFARSSGRLTDQPRPPGRRRSRAAWYGQMLDMRHLMDAWGNVDRGVSDLRQ